GEGWGGGWCSDAPTLPHTTTPTPNPSPQGGGEHTEHAAWVSHHLRFACGRNSAQIFAVCSPKAGTAPERGEAAALRACGAGALPASPGRWAPRAPSPGAATPT